MRSTILPSLVILVLVSLSGCGGGSDTEEADAVEATPSEAIQAPSGTNTDLDEFLDEYEEFVDQYCEFTEDLATANLAEMATMVERMSAQAMDLADFSAQAVAFQASASEEAQRRLKAMEDKAEECAANLPGGG